MFETLTKTIERESGKASATGAELAEARRLQAEYDRALKAINDHTDTVAKRDWVAHRGTLQKRITAGEALQGVTFENFLANYGEILSAAKEELRRVTADAKPLVATIAARFAKKANDFAAAYEKTARAEHDKFGAAYHPSELEHAFKKAAAFALARIPNSNYANSSPRQMLPYLDI